MKWVQTTASKPLHDTFLICCYQNVSILICEYRGDYWRSIEGEIFDDSDISHWSTLQSIALPNGDYEQQPDADIMIAKTIQAELERVLPAIVKSAISIVR